MVFILDGNSEIDAHGWIDLGYEISLRHLFKSITVKNLIKNFSFMRAQGVLSYHLIQIP